VVVTIETEEEAITMTDVVGVIATDQDHNTMIGDEMAAVTVVAEEVAEDAVVIVVVEGAEEEVAAVAEVDLAVNVIVRSPWIGIDRTVPDDVKLKGLKR